MILELLQVTVSKLVHDCSHLRANVAACMEQSGRQNCTWELSLASAIAVGKLPAGRETTGGRPGGVVEQWIKGC